MTNKQEPRGTKQKAKKYVCLPALNSFSESPFLLGATAHQKTPKERLPALPPGWFSELFPISNRRFTQRSPKQPQCYEESKQLLFYLGRLKRFQPLVSCTFLHWEAVLDLFFPSRHHRHPWVACRRLTLDFFLSTLPFTSRAPSKSISRAVLLGF